MNLFAAYSLCISLFFSL